MLILQLYSGQNTSTGDFVYRIAQTARGLSSLPGVEVLNRDLVAIAHLESLVEVPLLILHHISDPDILPVIRKRKESGRPTVFELADNFYQSNAHRPQTLSSGPPEYHLVLKEMIKRCDAVQVNNQRLAQYFSHLNEHFILAPNYIEQLNFGAVNNAQSPVLKIGWGGSDRHFQDIASISNPIVEWIQATENTLLLINSSERIRALFKTLPEHKVQFNRPGSLHGYLSFLDELDIGLAPLQPTEFNACRSDVKFLEYASHGVVPLCSKFAPYLETAALFPELPLFGNVAEMIGWLDRLRADDRLRQLSAQQAYDWVRNHRQANSEHWQQLYQQYLSLAAGTVAPAPDLDLLEHLFDDNAVSLLNEALLSPSATSTLSTLHNAIRESFRNYQLHYFYGWALSRIGKYKQAVEQLRTAIELNPESVRTLQLLTRVLLLMHDFENASTTIEQALAIEPGLATSLNLNAVVLQSLRRDRAAFKILKECLLTEPDYVDARLNLARSAIEIEEDFEAETSLQRLRRLTPKSAEVHYLQAVLAEKQGDLKQARQSALQALIFDEDHQKSRKLLQNLSREIVSNY